MRYCLSFFLTLAVFGPARGQSFSQWVIGEDRLPPITFDGHLHINVNGDNQIDSIVFPTTQVIVYKYDGKGAIKSKQFWNFAQEVNFKDFYPSSHEFEWAVLKELYVNKLPSIRESIKSFYKNEKDYARFVIGLFRGRYRILGTNIRVNHDLNRELDIALNQNKVTIDLIERLMTDVLANMGPDMDLSHKHQASLVTPLTVNDPRYERIRQGISVIQKCQPKRFKELSDAIASKRFYTIRDANRLEEVAPKHADFKVFRGNPFLKDSVMVVIDDLEKIKNRTPSSVFFQTYFGDAEFIHDYNSWFHGNLRISEALVHELGHMRQDILDSDGKAHSEFALFGFLDNQDSQELRSLQQHLTKTYFAERQRVSEYAAQMWMLDQLVPCLKPESK